jgi:hypothetical protein
MPSWQEYLGSLHQLVSYNCGIPNSLSQAAQLLCGYTSFEVVEQWGQRATCCIGPENTKHNWRWVSTCKLHSKREYGRHCICFQLRQNVGFHQWGWRVHNTGKDANPCSRHVYGQMLHMSVLPPRHAHLFTALPCKHSVAVADKQNSEGLASSYSISSTVIQSCP